MRAAKMIARKPFGHLAKLACLVQVEQQQLAIGVRSDLNGIFVVQRGTVTLLHRVLVQRRRATSKLHPHAVVWCDHVVNDMTRIEAGGIEPHILVDCDGAVFAIGITNHAEAVALLGFREMALFVARRETISGGQIQIWRK